jgi:3-deoxy-D-manno-octulosonic acid kinase
VSAGGVPPGYTLRRVGAARLVVRDALADVVAAALRDPRGSERTLYDYARQHPRARPLAGRATAYAAPLPDATPVVVRHSRHGGLLAPLTGDRFLAPTRAPRELAASLRLAAAGVPTPEVVAHATYPAGPPLLRLADVATREVARARDLGDALLARPSAGEVARLLDATAALLRALAAAGAWHPDLNVKNVLLADDGARVVAYVLDVDRVVFRRPGDPSVARRNLARLARSARKWRERRGAALDERDLAALAKLAGLDT